MTSFAIHVSGNFSANRFLTLEKKNESNSNIEPYRVWFRYQIKNWEFRVGLQKIDFGVAQLLRPIQWFNQIDPRDPLGLTNGVRGLLIRHYFKNNSNLWVWGLYGNEKQRGFGKGTDFIILDVSFNPKIPEGSFSKNILKK